MINHTIKAINCLISLFLTLLPTLSGLISHRKILRLDNRLFVCEKYCPDLSYQPQFNGLESAVDLCLPPCIYHIKPNRKWSSIVDCIVAEGKIPGHHVKKLIDYGAVYFAKSTTNKKPARLLQDQACNASSYIRVHVNPRRFVPANSINWQNRVLALPPALNFIVVNKPTAVPSLSTVDNALENVQTQIEKTSSFHRLLSLGRLDTCTSGLLVFATNKISAAYFHNLIRDRKIDKRYLVLTKTKPRVGNLKHWFPQSDLEHSSSSSSGSSSNRQQARHKNAKPGLLAIYNNELESDELIQGRYCIAELNVLSVREVTVTTEEEVQHCYESEVQLITGRTHQIRLQFSAEGWPVIGDLRYEPVAGLVTQLTNNEGESEVVRFGPEPKAIGLHCCELQLPLTGSESVKEEAEIAIEKHGIQSSYDHSTNMWRLQCHLPWWRTSS